MKRLLLGVLAACCSTLAFSQATEVVVETYAENIGMVGTEDLTGYNTYRIYVKFDSPDDFLTAVYGDADFPTKIQGGDNFFNSAIGGLTTKPTKRVFSRRFQIWNLTASSPSVWTHLRTFQRKLAKVWSTL